MTALTLVLLLLGLLLVGTAVFIVWRLRRRQRPQLEAPPSERGLPAPRPEPSLKPPKRPLDEPAPERRPEPKQEPQPPVPVRRAPPPWYPVVLAHGVLGFDTLRLGFLSPRYFRGVAERLRVAGNEVHVVCVSPVAGIAVRAAQLAHQIRQLQAERVNIVAHSMGGLDARYAITHLGLADRVASLTTIGTPHRGTPLADTGMWLVNERLKLRPLLAILGVDAFAELTTEYLEAFNQQVQNVRNVVYASYPAKVANGIRGVNALLAAGYMLLDRVAGDNDGVVPTQSQHWGEVLEEIHADHWAQVGWSKGFDAVEFYDQLVRALRRRRL